MGFGFNCQVQRRGFLTIFRETHLKLWVSRVRVRCRTTARRRSFLAGHLHQGRFKSFPVQGDDHFLTVCRYVERNVLRANLVKRAEDWPWSSFYRWLSGIAAEKALLSAWPLRRAADWLEHVNSPQTDAERTAIRRSVNQGAPFGDEAWASTATKSLDPRPGNHDPPTRKAQIQEKRFLTPFLMRMGSGPGSTANARLKHAASG